MKRLHDQIEEFPKEDVRSAIHRGISQAEKQRNDDIMQPKINKKRRKVLYTLGSVAAVFMILVGSSYYSPALASSLSQIPIIGSVFGNSDLIGLQQAQENGLTNKVGETQTVDGISVTLDEVLYTPSKITVGLIIETEKELEEHYFGAGMDITINGKLPKGSSGSYGEEIQSDTVITAIQEISVSEEMPDAFDLGLILHGENGEKWYFTTPIEKITDVQQIPLDHSQTVDGVELTVKELSLSEAGGSISFESLEDGTDFALSKGKYIEFKLVDQNGNEITSYSGGGSGEIRGDKLFYQSSKDFDPIDNSVTELTITPYLALPSGGGSVEIDENGESRELELNFDVLQPVEFESIKVEIPQ
ncbi:DUF4179 domain-containing protein [Gracilibacillus oryzae]|uniref:DUF4179 domain-containing protein n=1 Tax=Gracilibacillus oryzae TaxID=1672701 RepID=A0A7C8L0J2_9BACI|nr:DUF4179 domain-containing protein [Gracilibacillus oryzae]KAB8138130.1 DUF4179 domain-containing protein [Gracilibacillus oryzae]